MENVLTSGSGVAIVGRTTGSHVPPEVEDRWTILRTAEIRDGLVAEWRIYTDIEEAMKKAQASRQKTKLHAAPAFKVLPKVTLHLLSEESRSEVWSHPSHMVKSKVTGTSSMFKKT